MAGPLALTLIVAARIAASLWANVIQKKLLDPQGPTPLRLFVAVWGWMTLLTIPWWIVTLRAGEQFWFWMLLACALEVPGNILLLRSLRSTELSIYGPLSSIKPVISLALAFALFGEAPSRQGMLGVLVVLLGSILLTVRSETADAMTISRQQRRKGIRDRILAVALTALASVFLKETLDLANAWQSLSAWCVLSWTLSVVWLGVIQLRTPWFRAAPGKPTTAAAAVDTPADPTQPSIAGQRQRNHHRAVFMVAALMLAMQGCTILLFQRMPVGYALALFQIGSLASVLMGHHLFGEGALVQRVLAAVIMMAGAVMIVLA